MIMAGQELSRTSDNLSEILADNLTITDDSEVEFYYHDIEERVRTILTQPHMIVALILGFFAISMNILSMLAIIKMRGSLSSHYRFIMSLAMSDLLVGASVTLHIINNVVNPNYYPGYGPTLARLRSRCIYVVIKALNTTSLIITLLNLMGMAIDHFLAILKPLHYPTIMNKHRASVMIGVFWVIAIICGFSDFMSGYPKYPRHLHKFNYCEFIFLTKYQEEYTIFAIALVCFVTMTFTYVRIVVAIRQRHQGLPLRQDSVHRNQKAVVTTLLILCTFVICWLPMCLFQIVLIIQVKIDKSVLESWLSFLSKADSYLYDLLMLNAICDPIIYAIRMREIQIGYHRLFQCCYPKKNSSHCNNGEITMNTSTLLIHDGSMKSRISLASFKSSMKMPEYHPNLKKKVSVTTNPVTHIGTHHTCGINVMDATGV